MKQLLELLRKEVAVIIPDVATVRGKLQTDGRSFYIFNTDSSTRFTYDQVAMVRRVGDQWLIYLQEKRPDPITMKAVTL
jgi:hypothetical protein